MNEEQMIELESSILDLIRNDNRKNEMTLNREQIKQLAIYAGFHVQDVSGTDVGTEFEVHNGTIKGEFGEPDYVGMIVYDKQYPEDGAIPLD